MRMRHWVAAAVVIGSLACRGDRVDAQAPTSIARIVDSLAPVVEQATGLEFKRTPRSAMRSREQVRAYLAAKLNEELPPERAQGLETAYRLFGLLPDTLRLRPLLLALLTEQVAGYYDPDSTMLFGVVGGNASQLRLVLAHELVHALQDQHLPLDSLLEQRGSNDRLTAAQAILEGQATLATLRILSPGRDLAAQPGFWDLYREQVRAAQATMPEFGAAPLVIREGLVFPYVAGAHFMHWWAVEAGTDSMPYGSRMPRSTEQVLDPARYARGDAPVPVRVADSGSAVIHEDVLGELETRVLLAELAGADQVTDMPPLGWGGDRYRVYRTPDGPALVWYIVWDTPRAAARFLSRAERGLTARERPGYRAELTELTLDGRAAVRYVFAPEGWEGWGRVPEAEIASEPSGEPSR